MTSSHPTPAPCQWSSRLASALDRRSAPRLARLLLGAVLARGRRTVTAWIAAAKLPGQFRRCYTAVAAAGKNADFAAALLASEALRPIVAGGERLALAIDDTPTKRYGPEAQGAGTHHNPTPGPAGSAFVYGHCWVVLGLLADHKRWGTIALPLLARLYVRRKDLPGIRAEDRPEFRTKLVMAVELLTWAVKWLGWLKLPIWAVADGAYAKRDFLKPAMSMGITVVSRLRKDAALRTVPGPRPAGKRGRTRSGDPGPGGRSVQPGDGVPRLQAGGGCGPAAGAAVARQRGGVPRLPVGLYDDRGVGLGPVGGGVGGSFGVAVG